VVLNTGSALIQPETLPTPTGVLSPTDELPAERAGELPR
jgi:hypothetical protein